LNRSGTGEKYLAVQLLFW